MYTIYFSTLTDKNLKLNLHVYPINSKIRKTIFKSRELSNPLPFGTITIIYEALIVSILSHGITIYGNYSSSHVNILDITQKMFSKLFYIKLNFIPLIWFFSIAICIMLLDLLGRIIYWSWNIGVIMYEFWKEIKLLSSNLFYLRGLCITLDSYWVWHTFIYY